MEFTWMLALYSGLTGLLFGFLLGAYFGLRSGVVVKVGGGDDK